MGRSNYAILAMGLVSMLVMSMLMSYFLKAADRKGRSPVLQEIATAFGERLDAESKLVFEGGPERRIAKLTIHPVLGAGHQQLAREVGEFLWRRLGGDPTLGEVTVICQPWGDMDPISFAVPRPYLAPKPDSLRPSWRSAPSVPAGAGR